VSARRCLSQDILVKVCRLWRLSNFDSCICPARYCSNISHIMHGRGYVWAVPQYSRSYNFDILWTAIHPRSPLDPTIKACLTFFSTLSEPIRLRAVIRSLRIAGDFCQSHMNEYLLLRSSKLEAPRRNTFSSVFSLIRHDW
jgi:hypothetical protein